MAVFIIETYPVPSCSTYPLEPPNAPINSKSAATPSPASHFAASSSGRSVYISSPLCLDATSAALNYAPLSFAFANALRFFVLRLASSSALRFASSSALRFVSSSALLSKFPTAPLRLSRVNQVDAPVPTVRVAAPSPRLPSNGCAGSPSRTPIFPGVSSPV
jgi:hypothetical protein